MANIVHIVRANVQGRAKTGSTMPAPDSQPIAAETMTPGASTAQAALVGSIGQFWTVTVTGADVWVNFGADPTAVSGAGWLMSAGTRDFAVTAEGEKFACKLA